MSYVYFILDRFCNAIKIGKSDDVDDRLGTLQTGNPNDLEIVHKIKCSSDRASKRLEKLYHRHFNDIRIRGEWFRYEKELFENIFTDPIDIAKKNKREPLIRHTLYGPEIVFGIDTHPNCFFYGNEGLVAQILSSYEKSEKMSIPFRTMEWDTNGVQELWPWSTELNRVFISNKKHEENLKQKRFEKEKIKTKELNKPNILSTLELFF